MMITVYMVGRCLNKYGIDAIRTIKTGWIFGMWVVTIILMAIIRSIASDTVLWLNYGSPINVFSSTLLFLLFYRIPPFKSKCINWVGASCLSVFIFHTCYPMVEWFARKDVMFYKEGPFGLYVTKISCVIGLIFVSAILLDKVRLFIFAPFIRACGKVKTLN